MTTPDDRLWIKICGIREVDTVVNVARLGADAIGINFYDGSSRCVESVATAAAIVAALPDSVTAVGVFVNHSAEQIRGICTETGLRTVQLHGDEPDRLIRELSEFRVIRAMRTSGGFAEDAANHLKSYHALETSPAAWLIDARVDGAYGGTGQTVDWAMLAPQQRQPNWPPLILAGGLTPKNVAQAVTIVRPWGIDVASGVESAPGVKDLTLVEQFITECRRCS